MTDEAPDTSNNSNPITLPDDHPLVKTLAAQKDQVAKLKAAITPAEQLTALQDKAKRFDEHDARAEQLKVRDEVARAKGLTASLLRGSSKEDFEAHADELIAAGLKPAIAPPADGQGNTGTQVSTSDELSPDEVAPTSSAPRGGILRRIATWMSTRSPLSVWLLLADTSVPTNWRLSGVTSRPVWITPQRSSWLRKAFRCRQILLTPSETRGSQANRTSSPRCLSPRWPRRIHPLPDPARSSSQETPVPTKPRQLILEPNRRTTVNAKRGRSTSGRPGSPL